jgi:hypothetical protein
MKKLMSILMVATLAIMFASCEQGKSSGPVSDTGIEKAHADIEVGSDGLTVEQRNVKRRLEEDNKIGSIKHLYVISAMSGEVILYSTVDGKVTSGGKRLTNTESLEYGDRGQYEGNFVMPNIQDDGTYGSSMNYLYWWDTRGVYHQHYVTGGQIVHISAEAMPVTEITINLNTED